MLFLKKNIFLTFLILLLFSFNSWAQIPPELSASGNQPYCPLSSIPIVTDFDLSSGTDQVDAIFIQISEGYNKATDKLEYTGTNLNIKDEIFKTLEGKLELKWNGSGTANDAELIAAVKNVIFSSTSPSPSNDKTFSITIDKKNYLPKTQHYYEYISAPGITWTEAIDATALIPPYYGLLDPYLATIIYPEEAKICGEQAEGAGWIGGSDADVEGTWRWVTGPEAGKSFWIGTGNGTTVGTDISFAFWNKNNNPPEPNNANNEDYAHVVHPNLGGAEKGSWNDLRNTGDTNTGSLYHPQGYIVEYGGMPGNPILDLAKTTKIYIPKLTATSTPSPICGSGTATLSATSNTGFVLWFDDEGNRLDPPGDTYTTPLISQNTSYYALASSDGICETGARTKIDVIINSLPTIQPAVTLKNCDEDGNPDSYTDFNLTEADPFITNGDTSLAVTYYLTYDDADDDAGTTPPLNPSPFNNETASTVYARAENLEGCHRVATVSLEVSVTSFPPSFNYEMPECDKDLDNKGYATFDLTDASAYFLSQLTAPNLTVHYFKNLKDAELSEDEILPQDSYTNEEPDEQFLFVRVQSEDDGACYGIGQHLTLTVQPRPEFDLQAIPSDIFCLNLPPITIEPINAKDTYTYEWFDGNESLGVQPTLKVSKKGTYSAIATSLELCESFIQFIIISESNIATITINDISVTDDSDNNTITINTTDLGIGAYEFSLDGINYQNEPVFENVDAGIYNLFVNDKNGCGTTDPLQVSVIGYPKFFTPNNDGFNDTWQILGVSNNFYPTSLIYIFDRFGKLITTVDPTLDGWNGLYNNEVLPATDYWFTAQLIDENGGIREKKGHFSLIR